jgi:hypothetical protein
MSFWIAGAAVVAGVGGAVIGSKATKKAANAAGKASDQAIAEQQRQFDLVRQDTEGSRFIGKGATDTLARLYGYGTPSKPLSYEEWAAQNPQAVTPPQQQQKKHHGLLGHLKNAINPLEAFKDVGLIGGKEAAAPGSPGEAAYQQYVQGFQPTAQGAGTPDMGAFFESPDYQFNLDQGQQAIDRSAAARGGLLSGGAVKAGERYASGLASREYSSFVDRLMQQAGLGTTGIGASAAAGSAAASNIGNAYMNAGNAQGNAYMQQGQIVNNALQGTASNLLLQKYLGTAPRGG